MTVYKDVNMNTPTSQPDYSDVEAVTQSLINLILTRPGEKPFNPRYGIFMDALLFELMDEGAALQLLNEVVDKVKEFEPRAELNTSLSDVLADPDNNRFEVNLFFEILGFDGELFEVTQSIGR